MNIEEFSISEQYPDEWNKPCEHGCPSCGGVISVGEFECAGICHTCYCNSFSDEDETSPVYNED